MLLNAASRARNTGMTNNLCQGGGPAKAGLIPIRNKSSAAMLAIQKHVKSVPQTWLMTPVQRNVTVNMGIGRRPQGVRFSAWNTNGTSANVCMLNRMSGVTV